MLTLIGGIMFVVGLCVCGVSLGRPAKEMTNETWQEVKDISLMVFVMVLLGIGLYQTITFQK